MRFAKGRSGNPGGRPKLPDELKEAAMAHSAQAIETVASIMNDGKSTRPARLRAAEIILKKTVPDLSSVTMEADLKHHYELSDEMPTAEEWEREHCGPVIEH